MRSSRDPTITEVRVVDTYWSDHCRHTTFSTHIDRVEILDARGGRRLPSATWPPGRRCTDRRRPRPGPRR